MFKPAVYSVEAPGSVGGCMNNKGFHATKCVKLSKMKIRKAPPGGGPAGAARRGSRAEAVARAALARRKNYNNLLLSVERISISFPGRNGIDTFP